MRELNLQDLQKIELDILQDVHSFCEQHNIVYSIAYGSLIGAIRHKGFIPWDDDIDIIMPRPDFERFLNEYKSDKFELVSPHSNDSYIAYGRVCDNKRTISQSGIPWCSKDVGVWIDLFPVDGVSDNRDEFSMNMKKLHRVWRHQIRMRRSKAKFLLQHLFGMVSNSYSRLFYLAMQTYMLIMTNILKRILTSHLEVLLIGVRLYVLTRKIENSIV